MGWDVPIPFIELLGAKLLRMDGGEAEVRLPARDDLNNSFAVVHGGALMALLDVTMAHAARSVDRTMGAVTIEMKTSFMLPCRGELVALGRILHRTGSTAFIEGTIRDAQGTVCAHATGTFRYVRRQSPPGVVATD